MNHNEDIAIFAAGCFWGVQDYFDKVPGVLQTVVGYTGGELKNPTYEQVCSEMTGHAEAIIIIFDSAKLTYQQLVEHFFRMHDPTQINRQGPDIGSSYRSAIFYVNSQQKQIAEEIKQNLATKKKFDRLIVTEITEVGKFYRAEEYHQKFVQKNGYGACHISYKPVD
jgi:methionine-S-sulfoxide reductase